ncbi:MAG: ATP-binding cassette domain-containing protein [Bacteroidales bacterium]|nr:ATP-binding cassette domain-containing protein [Bacteroidales bacterium]
MKKKISSINIVNASSNNLQNISLQIPHNHLIVITGVSGSGKSSLAFDVLNRYGQHQFLSLLSNNNPKIQTQIAHAKVERIEGLSPTIALSQKTGISNERSTVGTLSGLYDDLRLLFSRYHQNEDPHLSRSHFSFNHANGACPHCKGIGLEDKISVDKLIEDPSKTIREGCFKITNPDGYIIYSQVTMESLEEVCKANGFSVDIPWNDLSEQQQDVVLNGSQAIKILYGKHTLESRMKWSGIKIKPREKEFYKGILPVMNQILNKDRNPNILRFASTQTCSICNGQRLNDRSLQYKINNLSIAEWSELSLDNLWHQLRSIECENSSLKKMTDAVVNSMSNKIKVLQELGLGYLSLSRRSSGLSPGEIQTIRTANLLQTQLSRVTYIFDEPSVGMHPKIQSKLIDIFRRLVAQGNTVIVVEHDLQTIQSADWIIEIGPNAGRNGGQLIFNGKADDFFKLEQKANENFYSETKTLQKQTKPIEKHSFFSLKNASINNLKHIDVRFKNQSLNVVTGVSGAGKSSLIHQTLIPLIRNEYYEQIHAKGYPLLVGFNIDKLTVLEQSPIGKTARSTPATYVKIFDQIRNLMASLPEAKACKLTASSFSFNTKGGRCEHCEGAGKIEVGMHFLGQVETLCPVCRGKRYETPLLEIKYQNRSIADILEMTVNEAYEFFDKNQANIAKNLNVLRAIGLGYLRLGQSSNTLSGGEAQRIRLCAELINASPKPHLYIFDEPSTGLHHKDIEKLILVFDSLIQKGHTIIIIEHNEQLIYEADHIIDLGPESGENGGNLVFEGSWNEFITSEQSATAKAIRTIPYYNKPKVTDKFPDSIELKNVSTNNLKNINLKFPHGRHTVVVGPSGSGKSSLVIDTLYTEAQARYLDSFPSYFRQFNLKHSDSKFASIEGLSPTLALSQNISIKDRRSTVGTLTGLYEQFRLLFSRFGKRLCPQCHSVIENNNCKHCNYKSEISRWSSAFSFNRSEGACENCRGLGKILNAPPHLLIKDQSRSFLDGALFNHPFVNSLVDINDQHWASLLAVGKAYSTDFSKALSDLAPEAIALAFDGTGDKIYDIEWEFKTKTDQGMHRFKGVWKGFSQLILEEYFKKHQNGKGEDLSSFLEYQTCSSCAGKRLKPEVLSVYYQNKNIAEFAEISFKELYQILPEKTNNEAETVLLQQTKKQIEHLIDFRLEHLSMNRDSVSLSGGEIQRLMLSKQLKEGLVGLTYVLDEPCSGLHPADIPEISAQINSLVEQGQTIISIEHNPAFIASAEHLVALGPKAGEEGGNIVFQGTTTDWLKKPKNINLKRIRKSTLKFDIEINAAHANNLKQIDVKFADQAFNIVCGRSGSGKTSLLKDVLLASRQHARNCFSVKGLEKYSGVVWLSQNNQKLNIVSTLASFLGLYDDLKKLMYKDLKSKSLKSNILSYHHPSGQCPECKGKGYLLTKLDFINNVKTTCETCGGRRFNNTALTVKWGAYNMADFLNFSIDEAIHAFPEKSILHKNCLMLQRLGLGYLKLGQDGQTFSGGELQRLYLAKTILQKESNQQLFLLDEPTRGLMDDDLPFVLNIFDELIGNGHTIIVIEHRPEMIKLADHVVELNNGELVYQGKVSELIQQNKSATAPFLL